MIHPLLIRPMEFWKLLTPNIVGFEIRIGYWISTEGRVYSEFINSIMKQSTDSDGYKVIGLYDIYKNQKTLRINRLVLLAFHPVANSINLQSNHINGVKSVNNEDNLEWTTASQNVQHAFNTGLHPRGIGEENAAASIDNATALKIGELLATEKYTYKEISEMINCSTKLIHRINSGKNWTFVYDKYDLKNKHIPLHNEIFTYNELHEICKYFQDNKITELTREIKDDILKKFNKESNYNTRKVLKRLFCRERHQSISKDYKF